MARPNVGAVLDTMTRADGAIGANWSNDPLHSGSVAAVIATNIAECQGAYSEMWWNAATFTQSGSVAAGITLAGTLPTKLATGGFNGWYLGLLQQPSAASATADGYQVELRRRTGTDTLTLIKYTNTAVALTLIAETNLASDLVIGDTFDIEVTTAGVINVYRNGTIIATATDTTAPIYFPNATTGIVGEWAVVDTSNISGITNFFAGNVVGTAVSDPAFPNLRRRQLLTAL